MEGSSVLLPLSGSQESLFAADFTWALAKETKSKVTAQHVVDIRGAFEFVGVQKAGLIGSGPYLAAYEAICSALRAVAEKLEDSYTSRVSSLGVANEFVVDEGDPVEEICNRASSHELIVVGHRQRNANFRPDCQVVKLSLAEMLAHRTPVPLLILQKPLQAVSELAIFCSMDHINKNWLNTCFQSASTISAKCSLTFLASGQNEEPPMEFVRDLKEANPEFDHTRIRIVSATSDGRPAQICCHHIGGESTADRERLVVIPTIDSGEHRITVSGECPTALLRRLSFGSILFWPEEYQKALFSAEDSLLATR